MDSGILKSWIPCILIAFLIVLVSGICPVMASSTVTVNNPGGSGDSALHTLGIWEQDNSPSLEDGDTGHTLSGSQFLPPCKSGADKEIQIFAIIPKRGETDPVSVTAIVKNSQDSFSRQVQLSSLTQREGIAATEQAARAGLITYITAKSVDEVISELQKGTVSVWEGETAIPSNQQAGYFTVIVTETGNTIDSSASANSFMYMPIACIEFDFTTVNYDEIRIGQENRVTGDDIFGTGDKPSVRNTGNCPARIRIAQNDMGFGKNQNGVWNIRYGIRLGDTMASRTYEPEQDVVVPDMVMPGSVEPIDFSIHVNEGSGGHSGSMNLAFDTVDCEMIEPEIAHIVDSDKSLPVPEFPQFADLFTQFMKFSNERVFA